MEYKYTFTEVKRQPGTIKTDANSSVKSGNQDKPKKPPTEDEGTNEGVEGFGKKIAEDSIQRGIISPLNSVTGGLASPVYSLGKSIATGASGAAIGGAVAGIAMAGLQLAVTKIQERVARLESQADAANERDNTLIRAGAKTAPTFYEANFFRGVVKTNRS